MVRRHLLAVIVALSGIHAWGAIGISGKANIAGQPEREHPGRSKTSLALIVAVGDYPGTEIDLPGAHTDARLIRSLLIDKYGFPIENVLTLLDSQATRGKVEKGFSEHLARAGPDGVALFYFSGHGTVMPGNYLVVPPQDPETEDEALVLGQCGLMLDDELGLLARELKVKRVVLILDCCFSAHAARGRWEKGVNLASSACLEIPDAFGSPVVGIGRRDEKDPRTFMEDNEEVLLLAASSGSQTAQVRDGLSGLGGGSTPDTSGAFTYELVEYLRMAPDSVTFEEAMSEVGKRTNAYVESRWNIEQVPQILGRARTQSVGVFLRND